MTKKFQTSSAFPEPNFTQVPNKFFDMLPDMESSEARVTAIMIRNTFGFHRNEFKMSVDKLAAAAGVSHNSAKSGAEAAEKRGTFKRSNPDENSEAEWELIIEDQPLTPLNECPIEDQPLTHNPSTIDPQSIVKESLKKNETKELNCATAPDAKAAKEILMLDLLFINVTHGYSLSEQIVKYNDAQGRKSTNRFASPQQMDAYREVIDKLNSRFVPVMIDAIAKRGASREKILAYCQMYLKNDAEQPQRRKESHARLETGNTVSDEGRAFAERLAARSQAHL